MSDEEFIAGALAQLWVAGKKIDWKGYHAQEQRRRLPMPTYPFERERFWIEPERESQSVAATIDGACEGSSRDRIFQSVMEARRSDRKGRAEHVGPWLIFEDRRDSALGSVNDPAPHGEQCFGAARPKLCATRGGQVQDRSG